jgi:hypothetical protein
LNCTPYAKPAASLQASTIPVFNVLPSDEFRAPQSGRAFLPRGVEFLQGGESAAEMD